VCKAEVFWHLYTVLSSAKSYTLCFCFGCLTHLGQQQLLSADFAGTSADLKNDKNRIPFLFVFLSSEKQ
jgi:hypothetical protein